MKRYRSKKIFELSCNVIPGGVNSAARAFKNVGIPPLVAKQGVGDLLIDADDNAFIDYVGSWGALILGHNHPEVMEAIETQLRLGTSFGVTTEIEALLATQICDRVPSVEQVRFVSSGTEATMSAVRLAKAITERPYLITFKGNYHGHSEATKGIELPYNDCEALKTCFAEYGDQIAAVILEPVAGNMGVVPATVEFLQCARDLCTDALLIFDEVMCGFRVHRQGAQGIYNVRPDLTCFGKIIGGGYPCGAFGGRKALMEQLTPTGPVFHAGTMSGHPVAMAAGLKTLEILGRRGIYEELERKAKLLTDGLDVCVQRRGGMFTLFWGVDMVHRLTDLDQELFKRYFLHLFERGIYVPQSPYEAGFISLAHTDAHLLKTKETIQELVHETIPLFKK